MGRALDVELRVIPARIANPFVDRVHYSGKHVNNSQLHLGAFLDGRLHGVMSFGPPMDKSKVLGLVEGTGWTQMIELNRMAFDEVLPRNSESRCISLAMKMLKKNAPHIKWVLSFADGCSCGDGTIYRASNFVLTQIKENSQTARLPNGEEIARLGVEGSCINTPRPELGGATPSQIAGGWQGVWEKYLEYTGAKMIPGFMLRYIYFIDPKWRKRLTVPELPYSAIRDAGAGMYRGKRR